MLETSERVEHADLPADYTMTEVGPLPEDWKVTTLGHVVLDAYK